MRKQQDEPAHAKKQGEKTDLLSSPGSSGQSIAGQSGDIWRAMKEHGQPPLQTI